jgi:uncharacterized repeat protein (TIGR03803 family)
MVTLPLLGNLQSCAARIYALAVAFILLSLAVGFPSPLQAQTTATQSILYSFTGSTDSESPAAQLIQGADGNFYGTTYGNLFSDFGSLFRISPAGDFTTLYNFNGATDGGTVLSNVIQGSDGNFYGTAYGNLLLAGTGAVFQISPSGAETTIYNFPGGAGGGNPETGLIQGSDGNFYGVSGDGGVGAGMAFNVTADGVLTPLQTFDGPDGSTTSTTLLQASDGNFYGTTSQGGANSLGEIFKLTPSGTLTVLYNFSGTGDGAAPIGALVEGSDGNLYGATGGTGAISAADGGDGTIFKITPAGVLTTLYLFTGASDGLSPWGLVWGSDGNLYGTTFTGGANSLGTAFQITPSGALTTLYAFTDASMGGSSSTQAGLVQGSDGNFYGASSAGGTSTAGTVFRLNMTPALAAPVQVTSSVAAADEGQSITLTWKVLNAFSTTLRQCYAFVEGGSKDAVWTGLQSGTYDATTQLYSGSAVVVPATSGTFSYALTCGGMESGSATVVVGTTPTLLVSTSTLANGTVATKYTQTLAATGGIAPYTWSVRSGSLPAGLTLASSTGAISGTPTATGSESFVVQVADSAATPNKATASLAINILPQPPAVTTVTLPDGLVNSAYATTLDAANGIPPYTWSIVTNGLGTSVLPAGLSLAPATGVISGTPTAAGTSSFAVKVTDSQTVPASATATLSLVIDPQLVPAGVVSISPTSLVAGQSATVSVTVTQPSGSIVPTGTVQFLSNNGNLGDPVKLKNGAASLAGQVFSATGTFAITANYSGDAHYVAVDFAPVNLTVSAAPLPTVTASPTTLSVTSGGTGTSTLSVANFSTSSFAFACSGLPADAACSFGALSSAGTSLLTITTNGAVASARQPGKDAHALYAMALPGLFAIAGLFFMRRRFPQWLVILLLLSAGLGMAACGGSASSNDTPKGTTAFTVTASGGGQSATVSMNLIVR